MKSELTPEFIQAVKDNTSIRQALIQLGLNPTGANYAKVKQLVKLYDIDTSHWVGQAHLKGKNHNWNNTQIPIEEVLVENSPYSRTKLKVRLIKLNILLDVCDVCGISEWQGKKLSLHLDHKNGVNDDNRIENLRLLCPNCHSLTETYCGKNVRKGKKQILTEDRAQTAFEIKERRKKFYYCDCGKQMYSKKSVQCKDCDNKNRKTKIDWPPNEELEARVKASNYSQVARELGVSDNAIRKRLKGGI